MQKNSIAIYGRAFNSSVVPYVEQLFAYLKEKDILIYIHADFYEFLRQQFACPETFLLYHNHKDLPGDIMFLLSLGGDGTMLSAVSQVRDSGIPIAGINFGRLGFLASISKSKMIQALDDIFAGNYTLQARDLLEVSGSNKTIFGTENFALNDITVFRHDTSSMITINAVLNGELLNSYWADGVIIATPTGSTAYSLSCGGPIIMPGSGNFVITPISPHNLNVRPIIISADSELELEIESRTEKYILSCDSKSETLDISTKLRVRRAPFRIHLIRLASDSFFSTLREKLLWGLDVRNY
ncbi:NAD+ kinase [Sphingobacterium allocomposti]|uniref:NAD kinase n=1 Tax=Sphingobacterium allocomposti TaxID=415956 RepID=A0A5S5DPZ9_9SPHI|nr:NAD kinase [Sphingobacterium composti Yoo et al. 2007 non Ten et al. 2007]TYP97754.1 NAD+ kinase [Sphingobacterium composti Yoo et al. 2007 non Ten et al. 2007]